MEKINNAQMVLRFYIGEEKTEERFRMMVDFLKRTGIRRVILFTTAFEETSAIVPLEYYQRHAQLLKPYMEQLKAMGIETGINMLHTVGHCFYADEHEFGFRRAVTVNNKPSRGTVCMRDPAFIEHVKQQYQYYAALRPSVIFTDDDIRMISLGQFICLCPEHIRLISERVQRKLTFDEIRDSVFSDTFADNPVRAAFFEQMKADIEFLIRQIADSVHAVSPSTEIGVMTKGYPTITADRDLKDFFAQFEGEKVCRIRPGIDYYREGDLNSIPLEFSQPAILRDFIDNPHIEIQPEIENDTYGFYQKSNRVTHMQITWCMTNGLRNMQLSLFPLHDDRFDNFDAITDSLTEHIDFYNRLCTLIPEGHRTDGIGLYVHPRSMTKMRALNGELIKDFQWLKWLYLIGMPISTDIKKSSFFLFSGDDIYLATDEEIDAYLRKGAVIDLRAAEALLARGYGDRIGVDSIAEVDATFAGERFTDHALNGEYACNVNSNYIYSTILPPGTIKRIVYKPGAESLSYYIDHHKAKICDGATIYENDRQERFMFLPYADDGFLFFSTVNHKRRRQLVNGFEWISRKPLPILSDNEKLCVNINRFDGYRVISLFNLSTDPVKTIKLKYTPVGTLQYVREDTGEIADLPYRAENGMLYVEKTIPTAGFVVLIDRGDG